jgi:hypothetical protein
MMETERPPKRWFPTTILHGSRAQKTTISVVIVVKTSNRAKIGGGGVFENRVLRRIFGPKRVELAGGWRRLHDKELYNLLASPNAVGVIKSRRKSWAGHLARVGRMRSAYRCFVGKLEGKRPLRRPTSR